MPRPLAIATALFVLALAPRLVLAGQSLFGDELWTYDIVTHGSLVDMFRAINEVESTPPLFHLLAWPAAQLFDPTLAIRWPSVVFGAITAPATFELGRRTAGLKVGVVAGLAIALDPFLVFYGSEARAYALACCLAVLALLAIVMYAEQRRGVWLLAFAVFSAGAVMSHYTAALPLAGAGLWALVKLPEARKELVAAAAAVAALVGAWLLAVGGGPAPQIVSAFYPTTLRNVGEALGKVMGGLPFTPFDRVPGVALGIVLVLAIVAGLGGLALAARKRTLPSLLVPVVAAAFGPPLLLLIGGVVGDDLFAPRNLLVIVPFAWLAIAAGLFELPWRAAGYAVAAVAVAGLALGTVMALSADERRPDYRGVADFIEQASEPGDQIVETQIFPQGAALQRTLSVQLPDGHEAIDSREADALDPSARLFVVTPSQTLGAPATVDVTGREELERRHFDGLTDLDVVLYGPAR